MERSKPDPDVAPSGKEAHGYGEIMLRVWFTDDSAEATIGADPEMPFDFYVVAAEQLMVLVGSRSKAGFKKALKLLVEGAMTSEGLSIDHKKEEGDESEGDGEADEVEEDL